MSDRIGDRGEYRDDLSNFVGSDERDRASTYAVVTCDDVSGRVLRHSMEPAPIRRELRLVLVDGQLMIYYDYCISCFWWGRSF